MSWLIQYLIGICASLGREFPHGGHLLPEQETVFFYSKILHVWTLSSFRKIKNRGQFTSLAGVYA